MRGKIKRPGSEPEVSEIENTLSALQEAVGGYIGTVTMAADAVVICNEEGRLMGLPYNLTLCGVSFVGTVLVCGVDGDEFADLAPEAEEACLDWMRRP